MPQQDDFQGSTRGASLSWNDKHSKGCYVNQWRGGLIISVDKGFATNMDTSKPKFWPDGAGNPDPTRPVKQRVITVLTNEKDPNNPVDTGLRSIYIEEESRRYSKKGKFRPGEVKEGTKYGAYLDSLAAAGVPGTLPEAGGYFYLCQTGAVEGAGDIPRKTWIANYRRPTPASIAELDRFIGATAAPQADDMADDHPNAGANPYGNGQPQQPSAPPAPPAPPQGQPTYQPPAPPQQHQAPPAGNGVVYAPAPPAPPQQPQYAPANGQQHTSPPPPPQPAYASGPYQQ